MDGCWEKQARGAGALDQDRADGGGWGQKNTKDTYANSLSGQVATKPLTAHPRDREPSSLGSSGCSISALCPLWVLALPLRTHTMLAPWPCQHPHSSRDRKSVV